MGLWKFLGTVVGIVFCGRESPPTATPLEEFDHLARSERINETAVSRSNPLRFGEA